MKTKPITILESPYAGNVKANVTYAQQCMHDMLLRGESPYASHLLYTHPNVLDDNEPEERKLGIESGFAFKHIPGAKTIFYVDLGWSNGMNMALDYCKKNNLEFDLRSLNARMGEI